MTATTTRGLRKCESCAAEIIWATTKNGKQCPIDSKPLPEGKFVLAVRPSDGNKIHMETFDPRRHEGRNRFTSHWATCPNAKDFRR